MTYSVYDLFILGRKCQFDPEKDHKDPDTKKISPLFISCSSNVIILILTNSNIYKTQKTHQTNMSTEDRKVALITGITGQDGSYLTELLLEKGYTVRTHARNQLIL